MARKKYNNIFKCFNRIKVLVIGDVMVDAYVMGRVERISPEAPVPVVSVEKRINRLGGAANVALNLKALGAEPLLCAVIGNDLKGKEFRALLNDENLSDQWIINSDDRITTTKFRIIGNRSQMLRVDEEVTCELSAGDEEMLFNRIKSLTEKIKVDVILFQDYNKGTLTTKLITNVIDLAKRKNILTTVDPKKKHFQDYKGVDLFKPNLKELREGLNRDIQNIDVGSLKDAANYIHENLDIATVMTTLSEHGVFISRRETPGHYDQHLIPAHVRQIADVSGAGDTVISVATLALACGLEPVDIATLSNLAGGMVCEEVGVVPVNFEKLLNEASALL